MYIVMYVRVCSTYYNILQYDDYTKEGFRSRSLFFVHVDFILRYYVHKILDIVYLFISTGRKLVTVKQAADGCASDDEIFSHCGRNVYI